MSGDAFGRVEPWSVGVEEEFLLVDAETLDLVGSSAEVVAAAGGADAESPKQELLATIVETATGVCDTPEAAAGRLREERERAAAAARAHGARLVATGSHPFAVPESQPVVAIPHYLEFARFAGPVARSQAVCGLHVHVAMPDGETALRALRAVLPWLPVVLAVSANSPFFRGAASGFLSTRAEVLATLPRSGAPPQPASYDEWQRVLERWERAGALRSFTWDARIKPEFGTLELRIADQPTDVDVSARLVAVLHDLAVRAARGDLASPSHAEDYPTNRFAAARFGPRAKLLWGERLVRAGELAEEVGLEPVCEADRQLEIGRDGDLRAVVADLVERSV